MRKMLAAMVLGSAMVAGAQMDGPKTAPAAHGPVEPAKAIDSLLNGFEGEMMSAAKAMPADKYGFSPASLNIPGAKYGDVRTFSAEVTHVAQANYSIYSAMSGRKPDVDVKAIANLKSKDEIVAALAGSFAFAHQAVATLTMANENDAVGGNGQTKYSLGAYGVAHGFDHYGQMVEYLRMNGIVPPASAK